MYPDRLMFVNPGGLYGAASTTELLRGTISFSRNAVLAKLLEDIEVAPMTRTVCENRGSGIKMITAELAAAKMPPLKLTASGGLFTAELRRTRQEPVLAVGRRGAPTFMAVPQAIDMIRAALSTGPKSTTELMDATGLTRPTLGNRLRELEAQGHIEPTAARRSPGVRWKLTGQEI